MFQILKTVTIGSCSVKGAAASICFFVSNVCVNSCEPYHLFSVLSWNQPFGTMRILGLNVKEQFLYYKRNGSNDGSSTWPVLLFYTLINL